MPADIFCASGREALSAGVRIQPCFGDLCQVCSAWQLEALCFCLHCFWFRTDKLGTKAQES